MVVQVVSESVHQIDRVVPALCCDVTWVKDKGDIAHVIPGQRLWLVCKLSWRVLNRVEDLWC